ncbi:MAG: cytochrome c [Sphingobium sp.]|nr:cytochrome c [Sphingobium sp.]
MRRRWRACVAILALGVAGASLAQQTGDTAGTGASTSSSASGEQTYKEICQACHMANAEGGKGAGNIPALAANPHLADANFVLTRLIRGQGGMPAFADMLSAEQIAGVATYVRTHFGNTYAAPVTVADVKRLSPAASGE